MTDEPPGPWYPGGAPHSRGRFTITSWMAAQGITAERLNTLQLQVLDYLHRQGDHGGTVDEIADELGVWRYTVAPRVTELSNHGLVHDSGQERPTPRGRQSVVWRYDPDGYWKPAPPKKPRRPAHHDHDPRTCEGCRTIYEAGRRSAGPQQMDLWPVTAPVGATVQGES